jgi:hypothetical protein
MVKPVTQMLSSEAVHLEKQKARGGNLFYESESSDNSSSS